MTTDRELILKKVYESFFNEKKINELARELMVSQRRRKIEPAQLVQSLVFAQGMAETKTLESIRLFYCRLTNTNLARSSFHEYFSPALAQLMKRLVDDFRQAHADVEWPMLNPELFTSVVIQDSSLITLRDALEASYPSCAFSGSKTKERDKAALKIHMGLNPLAVAPHTLDVTSARVYDGDGLVIDEGVRNTLLLFDRGYFKYATFHQIIHHGGYFITRYLKACDPPVAPFEMPLVPASSQSTAKKVRKLSTVLEEAITSSPPPSVVDVLLNPSDRYLKGGKRKPGELFTLRFVGIWNAEKKCYNGYFTNLPTEQVPPELVSQWYTYRWEIEMQFKCLKSYHKADHINTGKSYITETLLYAALLGWMLSRWMYFSLQSVDEQPKWDSPTLRFSAIFISSILWIVCARKNRSNKTWRELYHFFVQEIKNSSVNWKRNIKSVQRKHEETYSRVHGA
jgi:hypothetical protein